MALVKGYSVGLLLAGIGIMIGSGVPLAQTFWPGDTAPVQRQALAPGGSAAELAINRDLTAVPVILVTPAPGAFSSGDTALPYSFSMRRTDGEVLIRESGTATAFEASGGPAAETLRLRFKALTIPEGRWTVRFNAGPWGGAIQSVELHLLEPPPALIPALMTSLVLAILGWLAASLGALQWIRAEAARPPAAVAEAVRGDGARAWTVGCHLSALLGYILPFGHLLGPLAVWLWKRHAFPAVERAGRNALNFQLSITLYVLAALVLSFFLIGIAVLFVVVVFQFAAVLYAALRAQRGLDVVYPFTVRFI
ncbi:MAG: DUF4870 domain-containing protein [Gammaproteobacteria bacterium]|nr:DUF4870 domain-containing protein [Gammaproteobacteria bacterium]